jgi:hypothetical protein
VTRVRRRHAGNAASLSPNRPFIQTAGRTALRSLPTAVSSILSGERGGRLPANEISVFLEDGLAEGADRRRSSPSWSACGARARYACVGRRAGREAIEMHRHPGRRCRDVRALPVAADEGRSLRVRATAHSIDGFDTDQSAPSDPVQPAPAADGMTAPTPGLTSPPPPDPEPTTQPFPPHVPSPPTTGATWTPAARYLRPFPVVRVRGLFSERGAHVSLLRVTAPRSAGSSTAAPARAAPSGGAPDGPVAFARSSGTYRRACASRSPSRSAVTGSWASTCA